VLGERFGSEALRIGLEDVVSALREEAGKALDPRLVAGFIELLPRLQLEEARAQAAEMPAPVPPATLPPAPAATPQEAPSPSLQSKVDWAARTVVTLASSPFEHITLAHREVHTLYQLAQALSACLSVNDTMMQLVSRLGALVPFSTCALFLHDTAKREVACRFATGPGALKLEPMRVAVGEGPVGWVVEHEHALVNVSLTLEPMMTPERIITLASQHGSIEHSTAIIADTTDIAPSDIGLADRAANETEALRAALVCPLLVEGGCVGVLLVAQASGAAYDDEHRRILEQVGEHLAAAVQNSLRFERTREAALTDKLTGLTNSRGLAAAFESALSQAKEQNESMAVLMIDVDEFKAINDTFGHAAGDRALREVARTLSLSIRARDICARYAGDEFVLVLMRCGAPEADRRARELQAMFEAVRFAPEAGRLASLQISVGSAAYPVDGSSLETLLVVADRRMYRDKHQRKRATAGRRGASARMFRSFSA
jgi:diguanylate cyclase (GGDEF)-like protein